MHGFHNGCLVEWKNVTFVYNGQSHCVRIKGQPWPVFFLAGGGYLGMTSAQNKWPFSFFPSASEDAKLTCDSHSSRFSKHIQYHLKIKFFLYRNESLCATICYSSQEIENTANFLCQ
jgi:hypothetical protein